MANTNYPANQAEVVVPDTLLSKGESRGVYVGTGGNLEVQMMGDGQNITFTNIQDGTLLPIRIKQVVSAGTTATNIVSIF